MSLDFWITATRPTQVFDRNITHNLAEMAVEAGVYEALWRSEGKKASEIAPLLKEGLEKLTTNPAKFKKLNPSNGWGSYDSLVEFVKEALIACSEYPDGEIGVSR